MYMVLFAVRAQKGYSVDHFLDAMKEVFVPVTMTSLVNAGMFALMCINDVPAVYLTAQVALISVVFLYLTIICCFTAWSYLDVRRQFENRFDIAFCKKSRTGDHKQEKYWASFLYDSCYYPLILQSDSPRVARFLSHLIIWLGAGALLGLGIWALLEDQREIGLGLEVSVTRSELFAVLDAVAHVTSLQFRTFSRKTTKQVNGLRLGPRSWHPGASR